MMMMIKKETVQKVLNYLGTKPYIEVSELIADLLSQAQRAEEVVKKRSPVEEVKPVAD